MKESDPHIILSMDLGFIYSTLGANQQILNVVAVVMSLCIISVHVAHRSIPTTTPEQDESSILQPPSDSQPVAIDAKRGIWEAEALLAKWKLGNTTWYLVKWKGLPHEDNTWEKRKDIDLGLVKEFEATYQGNYLGVRLLEKRALRGKVEYLVEWIGRPKSEHSWEKDATISHERITEYEARRE